MTEFILAAQVVSEAIVSWANRLLSNDDVCVALLAVTWFIVGLLLALAITVF